MGIQMPSATVEEKENRVTERILTTIRAKTLLVGKVISTYVIGFVQVFTFFPCTAPITAPVCNALGSLPLWMAALVPQIAVGIFRYGSIEYGKKASLRGAFAARGNR